MNIVLIGGSIEALLLSLELVNEHNVSIVELEAEIGFRFIIRVVLST